MNSNSKGNVPFRWEQYYCEKEFGREEVPLGHQEKIGIHYWIWYNLSIFLRKYFPENIGNQLKKGVYLKHAFKLNPSFVFQKHKTVRFFYFYTMKWMVPQRVIFKAYKWKSIWIDSFWIEIKFLWEKWWVSNFWGYWIKLQHHLDYLILPNIFSS